DDAHRVIHVRTLHLVFDVDRNSVWRRYGHASNGGSAARRPADVRGAGPAEGRPAWWLHIQIANVECVVLDEFAAGLDLVAHECSEHLIRLRVIFRTDLKEGPNI